ncbi:MAG: metallophosphoesterase [Oscillospiraceae bacterium]|nr:metallophosphoesterase [Oscillospiraceae bacterium]
MALYAIGDLHLSFNSNKSMEVFGDGWFDYVNRIKLGFESLESTDITVLCGDISWGMSLDESIKDFKFIDALPGEKIILKGNHDYWWNTISKMNAFFEENKIKSIKILNNNCYYYNEVAICGTRGWMCEDDFSSEENIKIATRENMRLRSSLEAAKNAETKICFLHYPPITKGKDYCNLIPLMNEYDVKVCVYAHLHNYGHKSAVLGIIDGINYELVSSDFINFTPQKIMD